MVKKRKEINSPEEVNIKRRKRRFQRLVNRLFYALIASGLCFPILNIAFGNNVSLPISLYFLIIYSVVFIGIFFLVGGLTNGIVARTFWDSKDIKGSVLMMTFGLGFLALLVFLLWNYFVPMTLDLPRVILGKYSHMSGQVEKIEYSDRRSGRGTWYEKIQYVYFKEEATGNVIKVAFHANNPLASYSTKNVFYLPFSKWGIGVD